MKQSGCVLSLLRIERNVTDLSASLSFYCEALGFKHLYDDATNQWHRVAWMQQAKVRTAKIKKGTQEIWLTQCSSPGKPYPKDSKANDLWFQHFALVTNNIEEAYTQLSHYSYMPISKHGPEALPPSSGNVTAYKFRDPDGHPIELIYFPTLKADLGIDHTAISVSNTNRSILFYCDLLGFNFQARQVNQGREQEDLDGIGNVKVDVVALEPRLNSKPHLELLGYHGDKPINSVIYDRCDIAADRTVLAVDNVKEILLRLKNAGYAVDEVHEHAVLLRDPDGHILILENV